MPDFSDSRSIPTWPEKATASPWDRVEPLLDPEQLQGRFLLGVPLVGQMPDPITKTTQRITPDLLKDMIVSAVAELEALIGIYIFPVQLRERKMFDRVEFEAYGYFRLEHRPIASIEQLAIVSSDDVNFFSIPSAWLELGNMHRGQINILPLSPAQATFTLQSLAGGPAALVFLTHLTRLGWIPAYWTATYTAGFPDGRIPRLINDAIGMQTAINILSMLSATFTKNSQSLGIDGLSQSTSGPGPQQFTNRIKELQEKLDKIIGRVKAKVGLKLIIGSI